MMKAVRLVRFEAKNSDGEIKIVKIDRSDIIRVATALKKAGYKLIRNSFQVSDTIVINNTHIVKKAA